MLLGVADEKMAEVQRKQELVRKGKESEQNKWKEEVQRL